MIIVLDELKTVVKKIILRLRFHKRKPVFIWQVGKVGSVSIYHALANHVPCMSMHHPLQLDECLHRFYNVDKYKLRKSFHDKYAIKNVITGTRDPVERNISAFFQNMARVGSPWFVGTKNEILKKDIRNLTKLFLNIPIKEHELILHWFDYAFRDYWNIDLYECGFDPSLGYAIYEFDKARILVIRQENLSEIGIPALKQFLNIGSSNISLESRHRTKSKWCGPLYAEFKKNVVIPKWYLDLMYDSRYMQHFYSTEEVQFFRNKWTAGRA